MKRLYSGIILSLALVAGWSCDKNENDLFKQNVKPEVTVVSGADIAFKAIGGEGDIQVEPQEETLQASTDQGWCHLSVEGNRIHVKVDGYTGLESRYAKINMTAGEASGVTIVHQYGIIVRNFDSSDISLNNDAQETAVFYDANGSVIEAESDVEWAQVIVEPDSLRIRLSQNESFEYREAHIHWHFGQMKGDITVSQFDLGQAGLLGDWTFYAVNAATGRAFSYYPLDAVLSEASDGTYTLAVTKQSGNVEVDYNITGLTLQKNWLMLPLGKRIGTHKPNQNNLYQVFPLFAEGTSAVLYNNAVTTGYFPFEIVKDSETGVWRATGDPSSFGDLVFRFEFWSDKNHTGASNSRTALKDLYMVKN